MIAGYVLLGLFGINLLYTLFVYAVRHDGWFVVYNPDFGSHTNAELGFQIVWSIILILIAWAVVALSRRKMKALK